MRTVQLKERVPYSASQMFDLVNDIESYPAFLHWCRGARVDERSDGSMVATLDVGIGGLRKRFTTRNALEPPRRIAIELVDGPFRNLHGAWAFEDENETGCAVELALAFEVAHTPLDRVFGLLFEEIARSQVGAFVRRARALYG